MTETTTIEFKNYKYPFNKTLKTKIKNLFCAFLNTNGGRLYLGIDDQSKVIGIKMTAKEMDQFKISMSYMANKIVPPIDGSNITTKFIPIIDKDSIIKG